MIQVCLFFNSDEDWIQVLLFAAFREVLSDDGDKKILDAIQEILSEQVTR